MVRVCISGADHDSQQKEPTVTAEPKPHRGLVFVRREETEGRHRKISPPDPAGLEPKNFVTKAITSLIYNQFPINTLV
jgi:hypothetical protein